MCLKEKRIVSKPTDPAPLHRVRALLLCLVDLKCHFLCWAGAQHFMQNAMLQSRPHDKLAVVWN